MIMGGCPYCDEPYMEPVPDLPLPQMAKVACESCGKEFWQKYSRVDPCAYTLEEFAERYEIDSASNQIIDKLRRDSPPKSTKEIELEHQIMDALMKQFEHYILYGESTGEPCVGLFDSLPKRD